MITAPVFSSRVACALPLGVAQRQPYLLRGMMNQRLQLRQAAPLAKASRRPLAVKVPPYDHSLHARLVVLFSARVPECGPGTALLQAQADAGGDGTPVQRHAFLHDFCMCIPYGGLVTLGGLVMMLFGVGQVAKLIAGAGVSMLVLSTLSLKSWRAQQPVAKLFTLLEAGAEGRQRHKSPAIHTLALFSHLAAAAAALEV